eukprot:Rhum_TRINITY_DN13374_c0_g1::Rhum_TRINITY_DN13374_c0_g1_i1::g.59590::m.59590
MSDVMRCSSSLLIVPFRSVSTSRNSRVVASCDSSSFPLQNRQNCSLSTSPSVSAVNTFRTPPRLSTCTLNRCTSRDSSSTYRRVARSVCCSSLLTGVISRRSIRAAFARSASVGTCPSFPAALFPRARRSSGSISRARLWSTIHSAASICRHVFEWSSIRCRSAAWIRCRSGMFANSTAASLAPPSPCRRNGAHSGMKRVATSRSWSTNVRSVRSSSAVAARIASPIFSPERASAAALPFRVPAAAAAAPSTGNELSFGVVTTVAGMLPRFGGRARFSASLSPRRRVPFSPAAASSSSPPSASLPAPP